MDREELQRNFLFSGLTLTMVLLLMCVLVVLSDFTLRYLVRIILCYLEERDTSLAS